MRQCLCTNCGHQFQHNPVGGKLILAATGAVLGRTHPYGALIGPLLGLAFGSAVDRFIEQEVDPSCPACGFVIRALSRAL